MNFAVWWDGDLQRELLNGTTIDKWNPSTNSTTRQLTAYNFGAADNNSTKATPNLSADLLGDWREEVIWRSNDNTQLLLFTTTIPTTNRIYTLMHDPQYRLAIAWQNTAYNQPPHPSFYLGGGMTAAPSPNITLVGASTTTPPTGSSLANGTYTITARHSGQLLDVAENSTADGANVTQYTAQGSNNQKWLLTSTGDGYYTIKAVHSGKSLDVNGASTADGANVQQWTASTATHQQFSLVDQGGGYYQIVAHHSGKCVDVDNASTTAGANVQQWSCNATATNQQFRFTAVSAARMGRDEASLVAYPNPSGNVFRINIAGPFSYEIRNQMGQLLEKGEGNEETSVGSKLMPGLYLLQLQTSQGLREIKLIKH